MPSDYKREGESIGRWYRPILWHQSARRARSRFRCHQCLGQGANVLAQYIVSELFEELANKRREIQQQEAGTRRFGQDLFYRLSVFPHELPPLLSRKDDIPLRWGHVMAQVSFCRP
jgi:hypothetical protein